MTLPGCSPASKSVWFEDFEGPGIDRSTWEHQIGDGTAYDLPPGWGNAEMQRYTDSPENSEVVDGVLRIVVRRSGDGGAGFTSARLRTHKRLEFRYGRIAARIRIPSGKGLWPAFWLLPTDSPYGSWAAGGEIDIMESVNRADTIYGTIHFGGEWPANARSGGEYAVPGVDFSDEFHVYAVEWEPNEIRWSVDGEIYHRETSDGWYSEAAPDNPRAPFDTPFHILLNVAVGGHWPGTPDETTRLPQAMEVDWIGIWSIEDVEEVTVFDLPTGPSIAEPRID